MIIELLPLVCSSIQLCLSALCRPVVVVGDGAAAYSLNEMCAQEQSSGFLGCTYFVNH